MQLDKTQIAIRERGVLDTLDLSLHVLRSYFRPLLLTMAFGAVPLMLLNQFAIGWMFAESDAEIEFPIRYVWHMVVLVVVEAPLASAFATKYLGQAVFLEKPRLREVLIDVLRLFPRLLWCQVLLRGPALAIILALSIEPNSSFDGFLEGFLATCLLLYAVAVRSFWPFINEVVLLERNPLISRQEKVLSVGKRSRMLHGPSYGDLLFRWLGAAVIGLMLFFSFYGMFIFMSGIFLNDWSQGPLLIQLCLPLSMWLVAGYFTVYRFLSYLDLRIRQEGWEVELRMRAESTRLHARLTGSGAAGI